MMLLAFVAAVCLPVHGPTITAKDIAMAVPAYTARDGSAVFGYSPTPGVQRIVHPAELEQFLRRENFTGVMPAADVCFERPTAPVSEDAAKKAMQAVLGADAHIEIVELSRFRAPLGPLVFERRDLGNPPIALWRGYVTYDGDKKFPVWARVKISVRMSRIVALEDLRPGVPIRVDQVTLQDMDDFPGSRTTPADIAKVIGAMPRRFINAKTPVWDDAIDPPDQIMRGDLVSVTVHSGQARLIVDAEAEASGRLGDMISFKNPESGRMFRARVDGPDQALIETGGGKP